MGTNLILSGMMGTGKTSVGHLLAQRLGRAFIDLDAEIEAAAGMAVEAIFEREGEEGFRARERAAVRQLAGIRDAVIATGGWTVADPSCRDALGALGAVVCLTASVEALTARLGAAEAVSRPVLGCEPPGSVRLARLVDARRPVYDSLPLQVDTTGRDAPSVADQVLALTSATAGLSLTALPVTTPAGGYSILVGPGLLDAVGQIAAAHGIGGRAVVVADPTVGRLLYADRLVASLATAGIEAERLTMAAGEAAKSLTGVAALYDGFLKADLGRDGTVFAVGGGVVGDTAGYAAATYMRGVTLIQVPTTLLAMVDASIGGKTGVNMPLGKNLVGAFKHPELVTADPVLLATLPPAVLRAGLAEVVKAALIADVGLLERLERAGKPPADDSAAWAEVVCLAAAVKAMIVSEDPEERGQRVVLNLGHTFAHALERVTDYEMAHGDAVAIGLVAAARLSVRLGQADPALAERLEALFASLDLPTRFTGPPVADLMAAMGTDKKRRSGRLRFVLPRAPGEVGITEDVAAEDVAAVLRSLTEAHR